MIQAYRIKSPKNHKQIKPQKPKNHQTHEKLVKTPIATHKQERERGGKRKRE